MRDISTSLNLGENGIWYSLDSEFVSYPSEGSDTYFSVEDGSFWFKHRNNCIVSIVKAFPPADNETIFDIGGGNGYVSLGLSNAGFDVALVEPDTNGCMNAQKRGIKNIICATTSTAKFKSYSLPAVGLFDVIEHIEDDLDFLQSIKTLIKKDGYLYATVPSYSWLWSEQDVLAGHYRRYSLESISDVLKTAGFHIEFASYIFRFLPFPIFFLRSLPDKFGLTKRKINTGAVSRDHATSGGATTRILYSILQPEIENLNKKKSMIFGASCLIVAKSID